MLDCYICLEKIHGVPLLRCGHFVCPRCYCRCKDVGINNCSVCDRKLTRGTKKNK